jgi:hypothetical protein
MSKPLIQKAYIVGVHRYAFRAGEVAEIIGMKYVKPTGYNWRLAMVVEYVDGFIDYVAFEDVSSGNYEIISDVQLGLGQIPKIKY